MGYQGETFTLKLARSHRGFKGINRRKRMWWVVSANGIVNGVLRGNGVDVRLSPSPWDPLLISPWEGEGDCFSLGEGV